MSQPVKKIILPMRAMRFGPKGVTRYVDRRGDLYTYMVFDDKR